jgi:hypothetical protein
VKDVFENYLLSLRQDRDDKTEHSDRGPLETLLNKVAEGPISRRLFADLLRLIANKIHIFGARHANVSGLGAREPCVEEMACQSPSKIAISALTRPSAGHPIISIWAALYSFAVHCRGGKSFFGDRATRLLIERGT